MPCPTCGGRDRRPIAPGLWECVTQLRHTGYMPVPGASGRPAPLEPHVSFYACGTRYQEGASATSGAPKCECGVFAVAECSECGLPLCGDHLLRFESRAVCGADRSRLQAAAEQARAEASLAAFQRGCDALASWCATADDEAERFALFAYWGPGTTTKPCTPQYTALTKAAERVFGPNSSVRIGFGTKSQWTIDGPQFAQWAFAVAPRAAHARVRFTSRPFWPYLSWSFPAGSVPTLHVTTNTDQPDPDHYTRPTQSHLTENGHVLIADEKIKASSKDKSRLRQPAPTVDGPTAAAVLRLVGLQTPPATIDFR